MKKLNTAQLRLPVGYLLAGLALAGIGLYEAERHAQAKTAVANEKRPSAETARDTVFAEGRIVTPVGAEVTVASELTGLVKKLHAVEHQNVKKGDVLVELGTSVERAELAEARAHVAEAKVELAFFERELGRTQTLRERGVLPEAEFDKVKHQVDATVARITGLSAQVAILERRLEKAVLRAPISGKVLTQHISEGEVVQGGGPLFTLVDLSQLEVEAEIGEFDIPRVANGAMAAVVAEGFSKQSWSGKIVEVPEWVTSRRLKPLDPGRPSDTRVLPVKVSLPEGHPLKLGQRVEVQIAALAPEAETH